MMGSHGEQTPRKTIEALNVESSDIAMSHEHDVLLDADLPSQDDRPAVANSLPHRFRTMVVINAASVLEKTDEQLLPSVYKYVSCSFNASPGAVLVKQIVKL
jgi:hypothetical protein